MSQQSPSVNKLTVEKKQAPSPKGFWASRTTGEKSFIVTASSCCIIFFISVITVSVYIGYTLKGDSNIENAALSEPSTSNSSNENNDVCTTKGCVQAASSLINKMNESADPCNNFVDFACGTFLYDTQLSDQLLEHGFADVLAVKIRKKIRNALERKLKRKSEALKMAQISYEICMDRDLKEISKSKPLHEIIVDLGYWPMLHKDQWNEKNVDLTGLLIKCFKLDDKFGALFSLTAYRDHRNINFNLLTIESHMVNGLFDTRNYNTQRNLIYNVIRLIAQDAHIDLVQEDLIKDIQDMLNFMTELANVTDPQPDRYINIKFSDLVLISPHIKFDRLFHELAPDNVKPLIKKDTKINIVDYNSFIRMHDLIEKKGKRTVVNYIIWRIVFAYTNYLDSRFIKIRNENGVRGYYHGELWEECLAFVTDMMPLAVGAIYVDEAFTPEDKIVAEKMVDDLQETFVEMLKNNDWMDDETKKRAIEKVIFMKENVGYPDFIKDDVKLDDFYKMANISETDYFANLKTKRSEILLEMTFNKLLIKDNRAVFSDEVSEFNAFNFLQKNVIVVLAAILQKPLFGSDFPKFVNYGSIGSIIGHEISHAFDDEGSTIDKEGYIRNWWTNKSAEVFSDKTDCLVEQYSNISIPNSSARVNGTMTLGENIGDNGGLRNAYYAYENYVRKNGPEKRLPGLQKYTNKQLFFVSFAQFHCRKQSEKSLKHQIKTDVHSPGYVRIIGTLSNSKEFAETYQCPTDSEYNPSYKCTVW